MPPASEAVRKRLWPNESGGRDIWVILDGARDKRIYGHVVDTYLESCCLYAEALAPELELAAPYMIQLEYDDRLTLRILNEGWGHSWGIFLKSEATLKKLRRHLREFLVVTGPGGQQLVFRYYDPRVLRVYLPTCTVDELRTVFGPIDVFWTEGDDPSTLLEFRFDGVKLLQTALPFNEVAR
jgi:hypothetical protein